MPIGRSSSVHHFHLCNLVFLKCAQRTLGFIIPHTEGIPPSGVIEILFREVVIVALTQTNDHTTGGPKGKGTRGLTGGLYIIHPYSHFVAGVVLHLEVPELIVIGVGVLFENGWCGTGWCHCKYKTLRGEVEEDQVAGQKQKSDSSRFYGIRTALLSTIWDRIVVQVVVDVTMACGLAHDDRSTSEQTNR